MAAAGMELLGDMANRDHLIIADAIVSKKSAPGTMMILRDEEVPALFTNKISRISLAWPTYCRPCASPVSFRKADPGRRDPGIAGATSA